MRLLRIPPSPTRPAFQSTHSLRSATFLFEFELREEKSFNPRTPCGVRRLRAHTRRLHFTFQSTHSLRSATGAVDVHSPDYYVSIHALLAECDLCGGQACAVSDGFNPRTPCGVRHRSNILTTNNRKFQSTHSLRSATGCCCPCPPSYTVSIHALLAECDGSSCNDSGMPMVSIHALLAECDGIGMIGPRIATVSIHALLAECDEHPGTIKETLTSFNPRTPCGVRLTDIATAVDSGNVSIHALLAECDADLDMIHMWEGVFQSTHSLRSATFTTDASAR